MYCITNDVKVIQGIGYLQVLAARDRLPGPVVNEFTKKPVGP